MILSMILFGILSFLATARGGSQGIYKRGVPHYEFDSYQFEGENNIDDFSHFSDFSHHLPAYSTVSYIMSSGHHKPVSYSGFTNHGRGHHDPGYSVQYRSDGFATEEKEHHYY